MSSGLINTFVSNLVELAPSSASPILDTYVCTLVAALGTKPPDKVYGPILDVLLHMFLCEETNVTTSVHALHTLKHSMTTHKNHMITWSAKAMTTGQHHPKQVLNYLILIYSNDTTNQVLHAKFLSNNLHHLLPPIILNSVNSNQESTSAVDATLEMISG